MLAMYQPRPALPETGFVRLPQILSLIPISRSAGSPVMADACAAVR